MGPDDRWRSWTHSGAFEPGEIGAGQSGNLLIAPIRWQSQAQINGAKLVTRRKKKGWMSGTFGMHRSGVDMRIVLKTLCLQLTSRLSSREMAADAEQVRSKASNFIGSSDRLATEVAVDVIEARGNELLQLLGHMKTAA